MCYHTSKEGWGTHLNERTAKGTWSLPESKLHINHLELKGVFLALKEFQDLCSNNIVLVATGNTTMVTYINKEGRMKLGSLCALLWRILFWCTRKQVTLKAPHIPSWLNVIADKLSRLGQTIQTELSLHPEVYQAISSQWHQPQVDLFDTRFNNKLPLSLSREDLNPYAFPPVAILGGGEVAGLPMQQNIEYTILICTRVAQNAQVLGSSGHVQSDPIMSAPSLPGS